MQVIYSVSIINNNANKPESSLDNEREAIERERELLENEKIAFQQNHKKVQSFHSSEPIELNIGGKKFCTTLDTLTKYRDSFFGAMFSGYIALKPTKNGSYFIDRDGKNFHYILNFLRTSELIVPQNKPHLIKMLLLEAEFYQISELIEKLGNKTKNESFIESTILPPSQPQFSEKLNEWANCEYDQKWKLIYKGSRDGFKASVFHQKCDNQGATYTIIKSRNSIFGGYNPVSWLSNQTWSNGKDSFLFSLVNIYNIAPTKLANIDRTAGAYNDVNYLFLFGTGADLMVYNHCNIWSHSTNIFKSYENTTSQKYLLTGSQKFEIDEMEVFTRV